MGDQAIPFRFLEDAGRTFFVAFIADNEGWPEHYLGNPIALAFKLFQLASGMTLEAHEIEFRKLCDHQERSHEARVDRGHEEMLGRPGPSISLKLRRSRDAEF